MTLQLSQRALTEALTFNGSSTSGFVPEADERWLLQTVGDPTAGQVVRGELDPDSVARQDPDEVHPELAGDVGQHAVAVLKFDGEHSVRERLEDRPLDFDRVFLGHGRCCVPFSRRVPARRADTRTRSVSEPGPIGQTTSGRWRR